MSTIDRPQPTQTGQETEPTTTPETATTWAPPAGPPLGNEVPPPPVLQAAETPPVAPTSLDTMTPLEDHSPRVTRRRGVLYTGLAVLGVGAAGVLIGTQVGGDSGDREPVTAEAPPSTDPGDSIVTTTLPGDSVTESTIDTPDTTTSPEVNTNGYTIPMLEGHSTAPYSENIYIPDNERLYPRANETVEPLNTDDPNLMMTRTLHNLEAIVNYEDRAAYDMMFPHGEVDPEHGVLGRMEDISLQHTIAGDYKLYYVGRLVDYEFTDDAGERRILSEVLVYDSADDVDHHINYLFTYGSATDAEGDTTWFINPDGVRVTTYYTLDEADADPLG